MSTVSETADILVAALATIGFLVVVIAVHDEVLPRCQLWWSDIRAGRAHYQAIRRERRIQQRLDVVVVRTNWLFELAKQRMTAMADRFQPTLHQAASHRRQPDHIDPGDRS